MTQVQLEEICAFSSCARRYFHGDSEKPPMINPIRTAAARWWRIAATGSRPAMIKLQRKVLAFAFPLPVPLAKVRNVDGAFLVAMTAVCCLAPCATVVALAQASAERSADIAAYEEWCGGPRALTACVHEIIRVDTKLAALERQFQKTRQAYNYGNSLRGCQIYCILRHFPHGTAQECASTASTFKRAARTNPYLWKTDLARLLTEECPPFQPTP